MLGATREVRLGGTTGIMSYGIPLSADEREQILPVNVTTPHNRVSWANAHFGPIMR